MPTYNTGITRDAIVSAASADALIPTPVAQQIIQEAPASSAILSLARTVPMSTQTNRMPVLSVLPTAYWVSGDTGLKQTATQDWSNVVLTAEEIAVLVPIPQAYLDDAQVPIWDEVRPRIAEAFGALLDAAALFGVNKPSTFPTDIYTGAINAGNIVVAGAGTDLGVDVANMGRGLAKDGYAPNGFAVVPGFGWNLLGLRSSQGIPIYEPDMQNGSVSGKLWGYQMKEVQDGAMDPVKASVIAGDWSKAIVGIRQDISFKLFDSGVISDGSGVVIYNMMQQDSVVLRATMRVAFAVANPINKINSNNSTRYPFSVLSPIAALS